MSEYVYSGLDLVNMLRNPNNVGRKFVADNDRTIRITDEHTLCWTDLGKVYATISKRFLERTFKDAEPEYEQIDFATAMDLLNHHHRVYVKTMDNFKSVTVDTSFSCWPTALKPNSISDLMWHDFYKKNN